jgi:sec-independent protein translocase protein TatB
VFDVSFSELLVIAVVALLVIGPEKLPKVARTVGAFTGRMQRYMAQIKEEVNREMRFEELQKLQQEIKSSVENNVVKPIEHEADALRASIHAPSSDAEIKTESAKPKKIAKPKASTSKKPSTKKPLNDAD